MLTANIGIGDVEGAYPQKLRKKIFLSRYCVKFENFVNCLDKYHVKFRHFVNFHAYILAKMSCPSKLTKLLCLCVPVAGNTVIKACSTIHFVPQCH